MLQIQLLTDDNPQQYTLPTVGHSSVETAAQSTPASYLVWASIHLQVPSLQTGSNTWKFHSETTCNQITVRKINKTCLHLFRLDQLAQNWLGPRFKGVKVNITNMTLLHAFLNSSSKVGSNVLGFVSSNILKSSSKLSSIWAW